MKILDDRQIRQKIKRLAFQILEENFGTPEIILAGLNNNGLVFAQLLLEELMAVGTNTQFTLTRIRLNPASPLDYQPFIEMPAESLNGKCIVVVDDVANTGRTVFYAIRPLLEVLPQKVEVAVLIDREHKSFPVKADYVGLSLATTLKNDIDVQIQGVPEMAVFLN